MIKNVNNIKERDMKNLTVLVGLVLTLTLVGCHKEKEVEPLSPNTNSMIKSNPGDKMNTLPTTL